MTEAKRNEEKLLQSVALQNAASILKVRQRAEQELIDAKDELRRSNEMLRATFDEAAIGIALADLEGRLVEANRRMTQMLGYSREELRALTFFDITHPDDMAATRELSKQLVAGVVEDYSLEKRYLRKDGVTVWSRTSVTLMKDGEGRPMRFIGAVEDITRHKAAEEELRRTNEFNRTVIESSRDCIKTLTLTGELVWISDTGLRALHREDSDGLVGKSWVDFWAEDERPAARDALATAAQGGSAEFVGHFLIDGRTHWWEVALTPIRDSFGQPETLLAMSRDITERVALETDRRQLLESERAARAAAERRTGSAAATRARPITRKRPTRRPTGSR